MENSNKNVPKKELRLVNSNDLSEIADIHIAAFPTSSWTRLGKPVVEKYYLWQLNEIHPFVTAKSCYLDNRCVGFCFSGIFKGSTTGFIGTYQNLLIKRFLLKPWLVFLPEIRKGLLTSNRLLKNFRKTKANKHIENIEQTEKVKSYGILGIAVLPEFQGYGIGKILLTDAEKVARENNFKKMHLTVNTKNFNAINFYERLGWVKNPANESWSGIMEKSLVD